MRVDLGAIGDLRAWFWWMLSHWLCQQVNSVLAADFADLAELIEDQCLLLLAAFLIAQSDLLKVLSSHLGAHTPASLRCLT